MPLAAHGTFDGRQLRLDAAWGDPQGRLPLVQVHADATVTDFASADALGQHVAALLQAAGAQPARSEEHTSELQSQSNLVCRLLLEKKKKQKKKNNNDTDKQH